MIKPLDYYGVFFAWHDRPGLVAGPLGLPGGLVHLDPPVQGSPGGGLLTAMHRLHFAVAAPQDAKGAEQEGEFLGKKPHPCKAGMAQELRTAQN